MLSVALVGSLVDESVAEGGADESVADAVTLAEVTVESVEETEPSVAETFAAESVVDPSESVAEAATEESVSVTETESLTVVTTVVAEGVEVAAEDRAVEVALDEIVVGNDSVVLAELERLAQQKFE